MLAKIRSLLGGDDGEDVEPATGIEARKLKHRKRKLRSQIKDLEAAVKGSCASCMKKAVPANAKAASKKLDELKERKAHIEARLEAGRELEEGSG